MEDIEVIEDFSTKEDLMPTKQHRLNTREEAEQTEIFKTLQTLGIELNARATSEPKQLFDLQPIHPGSARVHDLPNGSVAVTLPAKLIVFGTVMITDALVVPEWDDCSLDLEEHREHQYFNEMIKDFPQITPEILNDFLVGHPQPLRPCQHEGLIIASGWTPVPTGYRDERLVKLKVLLMDAQNNRFRYDFSARVDRRLKVMYERNRQRLAERYPSRNAAADKEPVLPINQNQERATAKAAKSSRSQEYRGPIQ
jgi:hypothetical protein